jgi:hypothetical protein
MERERNPAQSDTIPPKWKFIAALILLPLLLAATVFSVWYAPADIPVWKVYVLVVLLALLAAIVTFLGIDGGLKLRYHHQLAGSRLAIDAFGSMAVLIVVLYVFSHVILPYFSPYQVRVYLTDESGRSIEDAEISTEGVEAFKHKLDHGWELLIPASNKPTSGKFTLIAANPNLFLHARMEVILDEDLTQTVRVEMIHDRSAVVAGKVMEETTLVPISRAKVFVEGNENESTLTDANGSFSVNARAAPGEYVHVQAEKPGFKTTQVNTATDQRVEIRLPRS